MILNYKKTADYLSNWIKDYATKAGTKTLILDLTGEIESALVALLCGQTGIPLICVNIHPSRNLYASTELAKTFAKEYGFQLFEKNLDATFEVFCNSISDLAKSHTAFNNNSDSVSENLQNTIHNLTLSVFANATNGLIVGSNDRSESNIIRCYQKYGNGCVDLSPIADLFKSEVYELFVYLAATITYNTHIGYNTYPMVGARYENYMPKGAEFIYNANPFDFLTSPIPYIHWTDIEWADQEDMKTQEDIGMAYSPINSPGIIFSELEPAKRPDFYRYTGRQQATLSKLHQVEKTTRHKFNPNLPICKIRNPKLGLVS